MATRERTTKKATEPAPAVVKERTADTNEYVLFIRQQPPTGGKVSAKAYFPLDRSTANARLAKLKRVYQKTYGTLEGFVGHVLVPAALPAEG